MPPAPDGPLRGVAVVVTRAREAADEMARPLAALGAEILLSPALRFADPDDWLPADTALHDAAAYDWAIFTSANGVDAVGRRLAALSLGWEVLSRARVAAIGPATARALEGRGVEVRVVPDSFHAEGILEALRGETVAGKRFLLARATKARDVLPDALRAQGGRVDVVPVYRTLRCEPSAVALAALRQRAGDRLVITFTSSSTVSNFLDALAPRDLAGARGSIAAAIGPVTAADLLARGVSPAILPAEFTVPALVAAIAAHYASGRGGGG
ncbi:MAG: uroporphyrinogen-III synthase [Acidobacteria bacterium]|nr:uroporphyrinogen-III synthase [Acidobacteriota bacterium]